MKSIPFSAAHGAVAVAILRKIMVPQNTVADDHTLFEGIDEAAALLHLLDHGMPVAPPPRAPRGPSKKKKVKRGAFRFPYRSPFLPASPHP